jgi:hypothetical protein
LPLHVEPDSTRGKNVVVTRACPPCSARSAPVPLPGDAFLCTIGWYVFWVVLSTRTTTKQRLSCYLMYLFGERCGACYNDIARCQPTVGSGETEEGAGNQRNKRKVWVTIVGRS